MKKPRATVASVKNNLSRYLAYVRRGGRVVIYNRDLPVAELTPVLREPASLPYGEDRLLRLEREGIVHRGTGRLSPELLRPPSGTHAGVLENLGEERRER